MLRAISFAILTAAFPLSAAAAVLPVAVAGPVEADHSGGCRKSSPPGQCCHAGSQPLHCHR